MSKLRRIDMAYWTTGDALASERVDHTLDICNRLGA
jgi:hypothetical protein